MKLLHPEVEITPGRAGKRPLVSPYQEREKLDGSVIVHLSNETTQNNAYTVRLRCDHPFWQEGWYTVTPLPPIPGAANTPSAPDVRGHGDRSVKVFVPRAGTRDILIRFNVPARPECRAGRYEYAIEVETQITDPQTTANGARRKDRVTRLTAVANVRPYYKWSLDLTPEQRRVGRRRRTGEFEVVVTNEGNDWLYCDLQLPRPKDLVLDCPTLRLAVPPPEPGELLPSTGIAEGRAGTQRSVPLLATTKLKIFRGDLTPQPLSVSALRVDAPSLPPPPEDGYASLGSVVATGTTEVQPAPPDRALVYAPPVPGKFVDFFSRIGGSFRSWIAPVLLLVVAIPAAFIVAQHVWFAVKINKFGTIDNKNLPEAGQKLIISGKDVIGSHVLITDKDGKTLYEEDSKTEKDVLRNAVPGTTTGPVKFNQCSITIPANLDHASGVLVVERLGAVFPYLAAILPKDHMPIQIGNLPPQHIPSKPEVTKLATGSFQSGASFIVGIKGFSEPGTVLLNHIAVVPLGWVLGTAQPHVTVSVPQGMPGQEFVVTLKLKDSPTEMDAGGITIAAPLVAVNPGGSIHAGSGGGSKPTGGGAKPAGGGDSKPSGGSATHPSGGGSKPVTSGTVSTAQAHYLPPNIVAAYNALLVDDTATALSKIGGGSDALSQAILAYIDAKNGPKNATNPAVSLIAANINSSDPSTKATALVARGVLYPKEAEADFRAALAAKPNFLLAHVALAQFLNDDDPGGAITEMNAAVKSAQGKEKAAAYYQRAHLYADNMDRADAKEDLTDALKADPSLKQSPNVVAFKAKLQ